MTAPYRLWINADSTVLVRLWRSGRLEVCHRADRDRIWGPPIVLDEEENPS